MIRASGLKDAFPPLRTVDAVPGNLPVPATSFVGRQVEVKQLAELVRAHRLITLTGVGGVGKTRLAVQVAWELVEEFPDGVWLVELGAAADAAQVAAEVMSVLGVQQDPGRPPLEVLAEVLAPRRLLLILDSCEHVLAATAELCGVLLRSADEVRVLATSREQLGLGGEAWYRLSPLELPVMQAPAGGPGLRAPRPSARA